MKKLTLTLFLWLGLLLPAISAAQNTPPFVPQDINLMLKNLHEAMELQKSATQPDGTTDPSVSEAIAEKLSQVDFTKLEDFKQAMGQMSEADILSAVPNMESFNGVLEGLSNGNVERTLRGAYDGLSSLYQNPNITAEDKTQIYNNLKNLYEGLRQKDVLGAVANNLKDNLSYVAEKYGYGDLISSLGKLGQGDLKNPQDLANKLAGVDWKKLDELMKKLGTPGLEGLKNLLPKGVDPALLGAAFDAFRNGGIDGLLQNLTNVLADKLKLVPSQDAAEIQAAIDKINDIKQKLKDDPLGTIGGLLGNLFKKGQKTSGGSPYPPGCKPDYMQDVMIDIMAGNNPDGSPNLLKPPGVVICN